ncbi:MAG: hypothetical protein K2P49_02120 [Oscillospiraceae bacterium]|nr:hypothetical protein [Oscillospiraceae bacterium]
MIWRRLKEMKKPSPEEDEAFRKGMEGMKVDWKERLLMTLTAYVVIVLPCLLILLALCLLAMWLFGIL